MGRVGLGVGCGRVGLGVVCGVMGLGVEWPGGRVGWGWGGVRWGEVLKFRLDWLAQAGVAVSHPTVAGAGVHEEVGGRTPKSMGVERCTATCARHYHLLRCASSLPDGMGWDGMDGIMTGGVWCGGIWWDGMEDTVICGWYRLVTYSACRHEINSIAAGSLCEMVRRRVASQPALRLCWGFGVSYHPPTFLAEIICM